MAGPSGQDFIQQMLQSDMLRSRPNTANEDDLMEAYKPDPRMQAFALAAQMSGNKEFGNATKMQLDFDKSNRMPAQIPGGLLVKNAQGGKGGVYRDPAQADDREMQRVLAMNQANQTAAQREATMAQQRELAAQRREDALARAQDQMERFRESQALRLTLAQQAQQAAAERAGNRDAYAQEKERRNVLKRATAAADKYNSAPDGKPLPPVERKALENNYKVHSAITTLQEEAEHLDKKGIKVGSDNDMLGTTAGGNAANWVARNVPQLSTEAMREKAAWWAKVQTMDSESRHELYGASLTPGESNEWNKQALLPGMTSTDIVKALKARQEIVKKAMLRQAESNVGSGYSAAGVAGSIPGIYEPPKRGQKSARDYIPSAAMIRQLEEDGELEPAGAGPQVSAPQGGGIAAPPPMAQTGQPAPQQQQPMPTPQQAPQAPGAGGLPQGWSVRVKP